MSLAVATGCALGAALGARHALEPDHLAAVSTMVAEKPRAGQAALLGALWGLGHAASLLIVGVALLAVSESLPDRFVAIAEGAVAVMLIVLGVRSIAVALRGGDGPTAVHRHGGAEHSHGGALGHVHVRGRVLAVRPLVIGLVHGLAGSGGLTALALTQMPTVGGAIGYIVAFGVGSVAGMAVVSGIAGASLGRLAGTPRARTALLAGAGALSVVVGVVWGVAAVA